MESCPFLPITLSGMAGRRKLRNSSHNGAHTHTRQGVGLENLLVQSLIAYGQLIMAQSDVDHYIRGVLESLGTAGRRLQQLL